MEKSEAQKPAWIKDRGRPDATTPSNPREAWPKPQDFPKFQPRWVTQGLTAKRNDSQGSQRASDYTSPSQPPSSP